MWKFYTLQASFFFKSPRLPFNWPTIYHAINSTNCPKLCAGCSSKHAQSDCPKQCKFESWKIFHTILVSKFPRESQKFNVDTNPHCNHCTVSPSPESIMYNNLWGFVRHQFARHSPDYCYYISPWYSPLCPHVPTTPSIMRFRRGMLRRLLMPQLGLRLRRRKRRRLRSARSWWGSLGRDGFGGGFPQRWPFCGRLKLWKHVRATGE